MAHFPAWVTAARLKFSTIIVMSIIHALALLAPFTFSWSGFFLCLVLVWVTGGHLLAADRQPLALRERLATHPVPRQTWLDAARS